MEHKLWVRNSGKTYNTFTPERQSACYREEITTMLTFYVVSVLDDFTVSYFDFDSI